MKRQFEHRLDDDAMAVTGLGMGSTNQYEIEPLEFQPSFESKIPSDILAEILKFGGASKQGFLVDNIIYFIVGKKLFLWNSGKTNFGIQMVKPKLSKNIQEAFEYTVREFSQPIQEISYIENYKKDFEPYVCVATKTQIMLLGFKRKENQHILSGRFNFDLTKLVESGYQPVNLDPGCEEVRCII